MGLITSMVRYKHFILIFIMDMGLSPWSFPLDRSLYGTIPLLHRILLYKNLNSQVSEFLKEEKQQNLV